MRTNLKTLLLATAVACSVLALTTAVAQNPPADTGLLANPVYLKNCAKCHGKTAEGRHFGGPAIISAKTAAESAGDLRNVIANGKGHMPKFTGKLTPEEIDSLVAQIQAVNKK
jgi:mono/diheme cytochrome c family protein